MSFSRRLVTIRRAALGTFGLSAFAASRLGVEIHGINQLSTVKVVVRKNRTRNQLMMNALKVNPSQSHYSDFLSVKSRRLIKGQAQAAKTPEANK
jgi:hypothetical protein